MVELANRAQVLELLAEFDDIKDKLTANELEMYSHIKDKYATSTDGSFDDKVCLEVMLRNIAVRADYGMDKNEATRVVDFEKADKKGE